MLERANLILKLTIKNLKIEISLGFWELVVAVTVVMGLGERERERERSIGKKNLLVSTTRIEECSREW